MDPCRLFAGNASRRLAVSICENLNVPLGDAEVSRFEDGEVSVKFNENIRGSDVFIIQATGAPADHLMELLVMLDAARRAEARFAASSMTSSSIRFSAGAPVAWMMNTSPPRMFSLNLTETSPSSKRPTSASPSGDFSF